MSRDSETELVCTPETLFGPTAIFTLPEQMPARQVAQLVNRLITLTDDPRDYRELLWRLEAAEQQIRALPNGTPERYLLQSIVDAIPLTGPSYAGVRARLADYVRYLEKELKLEDALQMLSLLARTHGRALPMPDFAIVALDAARLYRQTARWKEATACYRVAERTGVLLDDAVVRLRGRLGCGAVCRGQGDMQGAEKVARYGTFEAERWVLESVRVVALLDLSAALGEQSRYEEAIAVDRDALRFSSSKDERTRALGSIGVSLSDLGAYTECRQPLEAALAGAPAMIVQVNARLELMKVEAETGNRIGFENQREALASMRDRLPAGARAEFCHKLGRGFRLFGQRLRALAALEEAREIAHANMLGHWVRRVEQEFAECGVA